MEGFLENNQYSDDDDMFYEDNVDDNNNNLPQDRYSFLMRQYDEIYGEDDWPPLASGNNFDRDRVDHDRMRLLLDIRAERDRLRLEWEGSRHVEEQPMLSYYYDLDGTCRILDWGEYYIADDEKDSENGEEESDGSSEEEAEEVNEEDIEGENRPDLNHVDNVKQQTCHLFHL